MMLTEFPGGVWIDESQIVALTPAADHRSRPEVTVYLQGGKGFALVVGPAHEPATSTYGGHEEALAKAEAWIRKYVKTRTVNGVAGWGRICLPEIAGYEYAVADDGGYGK